MASKLVFILLIAVVACEPVMDMAKGAASKMSSTAGTATNVASSKAKEAKSAMGDLMKTGKGKANSMASTGISAGKNAKNKIGEYAATGKDKASEMASSGAKVAKSASNMASEKAKSAKTKAGEYASSGAGMASNVASGAKTQMGNAFGGMKNMASFKRDNFADENLQEEYIIDPEAIYEFVEDRFPSVRSIIENYLEVESKDQDSPNQSSSGSKPQEQHIRSLFDNLDAEPKDQGSPTSSGSKSQQKYPLNTRSLYFGMEPKGEGSPNPEPSGQKPEEQRFQSIRSFLGDHLEVETKEQGSPVPKNGEQKQK